MIHRYDLEIPETDIKQEDLEDMGISLSPQQLAEFENLDKDFDSSQLYDLLGMNNFDL